jgi:hypothetical protein
LLVVAAPGTFTRGSDSVKTWTVTWKNLTANQPLTPPILITHTNSLSIWQVGQLASAQVAFLAMDPNPGPLANALAGRPDVADVELGSGKTLPGGTGSVTVKTSGSADRLDLLTMLAKTNDTFTGLSNYHITGDATIDVYAYDAGTERNNWSFSYVPGLGGEFKLDSTTETGEPIHRTTDADLAGARTADTPSGAVDVSWPNTQPVATITITRTS